MKTTVVFHYPDLVKAEEEIVSEPFEMTTDHFKKQILEDPYLKKAQHTIGEIGYIQHIHFLEKPNDIDFGFLILSAMQGAEALVVENEIDACYREAYPYDHNEDLEASERAEQEAEESESIGSLLDEQNTHDDLFDGTGQWGHK